jgi:hypothetical protein
MKNKNKILIKFDIAKEGRTISREIFKGKLNPGFTHRDKTKYSRKNRTEKYD